MANPLGRAIPLLDLRVFLPIPNAPAGELVSHCAEGWHRRCMGHGDGERGSPPRLLRFTPATQRQTQHRGKASARISGDSRSAGSPTGKRPLPFRRDCRVAINPKGSLRTTEPMAHRLGSRRSHMCKVACPRHPKAQPKHPCVVLRNWAV